MAATFPCDENTAAWLPGANDRAIATLAHELRAPLGVMSNAVALLSMEPPDGEERRKEWGWVKPVLERQLKSMTRMVDDLLDASRAAAGRLELATEPVDLGAVLRFALETVRPLMEERRHTVVFHRPEEPVAVPGDPVRLEQVAVNLLTNAAKYTEAGGRVAVSLGREGADAVFRVRDTGEGMPPEFLPRAFDAFSQGEAAAGRSLGGLGIGLALVKSLVEAHGGTMEAESDGPGRGSVFTVRLPALPKDAPAVCGLPA